jgi:hypothetical protein
MRRFLFSWKPKSHHRHYTSPDLAPIDFNPAKSIQSSSPNSIFLLFSQLSLVFLVTGKQTESWRFFFCSVTRSELKVAETSPSCCYCDIWWCMKSFLLLSDTFSSGTEDQVQRDRKTHSSISGRYTILFSAPKSITSTWGNLQGSSVLQTKFLDTIPIFYKPSQTISQYLPEILRHI